MKDRVVFEDYIATENIRELTLVQFLRYPFYTPVFIYLHRLWFHYVFSWLFKFLNALLIITCLWKGYCKKFTEENHDAILFKRLHRFPLSVLCSRNCVAIIASCCWLTNLSSFFCTVDSLARDPLMFYYKLWCLNRLLCNFFVTKKFPRQKQQSSWDKVKKYCKYIWLFLFSAVHKCL